MNKPGNAIRHHVREENAMLKTWLPLIVGLTMFLSFSVAVRESAAMVSDGNERGETVAQPAKIPIDVVSVQPIPEKRQISFVVLSKSDKPITAWHAGIRVGTGPEAVSGGFGTDAYRAYVGVGPGSAHLLPGGTATVTAAMPPGAEATATAIAIMPDCAVFADRSVVGDQEFADFVFARRAASRDALQTIANDIREASKAAPNGLQALEQVLARLDAAIAADPNGFDPVRRGIVRPSVVAAIDAVKAGRADASARLDLILADVQANLAAAIAHSR